MLKLTSIADYLSRHRVWFLAMTLLISSFVVVKIFLSFATVYANASAYFAGPDEVATGSTFDITFKASVTRGGYSDCYAFGFFEVSGAGVVESVRSGNYPGVQASEWLFPGSYKLETPSCREGQQGYPSGTYTLATLRIRATGAGAITLNSSGFLMVNGSSLAITPKTIAVRTDVCPNIAGVQATIPSGMIKDASGNCVTPPPPDVCPNIAGVQATIPSGMIKDASGNCVTPPPPDVCPNIAGVQATIPSGMIKNSSGHCVYPPSTPTNPTPPTNPPVTTNPPSTGNPPGTGGGTTTPGVRPSPVLPTVPAEISPDDKDSMTITEDTPDTEKDDETGAINDVTVRAYPKSIEISWRGEVTLKDIKVRYGKDGEARELSASIINSEGSMHDATLLNLIPVTMYSIEISGVLEDGTVATYSGRAMTRGYPVGLYFKNGDTVLAKTKITVGGYDYETDDNGLRALELPSGKVEVVVVLEGGGGYREMIEVKDVTPNKDKVIPMQDFVIDVSAASMGSPLGYIIASILLGAVVSFLLFLLWRKRKRDKSDTDEWQPLTGVYSPMPAPIAPSAAAPLAAPSMPVAPLSTTPMPTHDYTPIFTQGQYHNPVAPGQAYQDPYQVLVDPQGGVDGDIEDIYEAARREGRFKNMQ